jgi:16S rRNA (cytosine967-C5)-methyltransferase
MIAPARLFSYRILLQIATSDAHGDELLRSPEVDRLSAVDRNLTTTLVLGTLRWQLALDARIRGLLARPGAKLSPEAATALRMGAYQLLHLARVPAHAVIHDSVELVKLSPERGAAGMVNAVLRKIQNSEHKAQSAGWQGARDRVQGAGQSSAFSDQRSRERSADSVQRSEKPGTSLGAKSGSAAAEVATAWAHPVWMVGRWVRRYGAEAAEAICRWDQVPVGVTLRMRGPVGEMQGVETETGAFLASARRVVRGDVGRSGAFLEGGIWIQDEASQLVAEIAAAAVPHAGRVMDTCAAPGGKTAILAERLPEAEITAVDVSRKRLDLMRERVLAARAGRFAVAPQGGVIFEVADAVKMQLKPEWDLILCDVPCSGTGTMARNPEIRLRVEEADLARQHARQVAILRVGLAGLKAGGRLVYSTCSLEPEENEGVVAEVLREMPGFRLVPAERILDQLAASGVVTVAGRERLRTATEGGYLRTLPGVHPCDGFFAAILERQSTGHREATSERPAKSEQKAVSKKLLAKSCHRKAGVPRARSELTAGEKLG